LRSSAALPRYVPGSFERLPAVRRWSPRSGTIASSLAHNAVRRLRKLELQTLRFSLRRVMPSPSEDLRKLDGWSGPAYRPSHRQPGLCSEVSKNRRLRPQATAIAAEIALGRALSSAPARAVVATRAPSRSPGGRPGNVRAHCEHCFPDPLREVPPERRSDSLVTPCERGSPRPPRPWSFTRGGHGTATVSVFCPC
jgi:hypothetical protein